MRTGLTPRNGGKTATANTGSRTNGKRDTRLWFPFGAAPSHPGRLHGQVLSPGYNSGYTKTVKTAVSLPDDLFRLAEATARRLRISRSALYAKAIAEYLKQQQDNAITERLNEVYSRRPAKLDSRLHRAQLKSLEKDAW